jgi:hypothetical protein
MSLKYILNIILIFGITSILHSQNVKVSAKIDSIAIELGDQTWLNLSVEQEKGDVVIFPEIKDTIIKGIDVLRINSIDTQLSNNRIIATQKVLITAFDDSIFQIPPFVFKHGEDSLFTNQLMLSVADIRMDSVELAKIDTAQMLRVFDIKEPINTPLTFKEFWQRFGWIIVISLATIAAIVLIIIFVVRASKDKPFIRIPEKPKEPAHIIAFRALDELKTKKLWQSGKEKQYYSELTEIIREYLENRYHIATFELTSHELLDSIQSKKLIVGELFNKLSQILSTADLAKFAKFKPLPAENDLCFKDTYRLVDETKKIQQVKAPESVSVKNNNENEPETITDEKNSN